MFGEPAQRLALSNGHIRWIIQGGWQTGGLEDSVSRWQGRHVTDWSGCQWCIRGKGCYVCVCVWQWEKHMRLVWWVYEKKIQSEEAVMCLWDLEAGMNRELPTLQRDSHAEFSASISITHSVPLMSNHGENCNCFHGFFSPEHTPWHQCFPFDVADTHFLRLWTNKP